jgi:hypothetical protein
MPRDSWTAAITLGGKEYDCEVELRRLSVEPGERAEVFFGRFDVGEAGVPELIEAAEVDSLAVNTNIRTPFLAVFPPAYALRVCPRTLCAIA